MDDDGTKEKAVSRRGVWSDLGRGSALNIERGKKRNQLLETKTQSRRSRVGLHLPFDQVKDLFRIGRSINPVSEIAPLKSRMMFAFEVGPFLSLERNALKSPKTVQ